MDDVAFVGLTVERLQEWAPEDRRWWRSLPDAERETVAMLVGLLDARPVEPWQDDDEA